MNKRQHKMERYIDGLELQIDYLREHDTFIINENTTLKEKMETITKTIRDLERDIEAICEYLEKEKEKEN